MLVYDDFYDMAVYANDNWRGKFTPKEIACYASEYFEEYKKSVKFKRQTLPIQTLFQNLLTDLKENNVYENEIDDVKMWLHELRIATV